MEKRRKALGLRKLNCNTEQKSTNLSPGPTPVQKNKRTQAVVVAEEGSTNKESLNHHRAAATNQSTPQRLGNVQSPESPLQSPGYQLMFPRNFGSPEVEVSWDWGCSQVPKDMVAQRRVKHGTRTQILSPVPVVMPCPRLPITRHMSEEENQERLAFYKNVLSKSSKNVPVKVTVGSSNNNVQEKGSPTETNTSSTPTRLMKSGVESFKKEDNINDFFNDSANDLMLECSQAVEEKLRNGEIDLGSMVGSKITNTKHLLSPLDEHEKAHKKLCFRRSKSNLFPESPKHLNGVGGDGFGGKKCLSLKSPKSKVLNTNLCVKAETPLPDSGVKNNQENDDAVMFMLPTQPNPVSAIDRMTVNNLTRDNKKNTESNGKVAYSTNNNLSTPQIINTANKYPVATNPSVQRVNNLNSGMSDRRPSQATHGPITKNHSINGGKYNIGHEVSVAKVQNHVNNANHDRIDKFRRVPNSIFINNNNQNPTNLDLVKKTSNAMTKPTPVPSNTVFKQSATCNFGNNVKSAQQTMQTKCPDSKPKIADLSSLLDDGFDMELSSLDFDSLCCNSQPKPPEPKSVVKSRPPKICTQQEIEAKRIAALNRLMMKKRR